MTRTIDYMAHLPDFYQGIREFEALARTENATFQQLAEDNAQDLADAFVLTASEASIAIWEAEIGIRADPSSETLEFRRKRLINRYTTKPPFPIRWLERQLTELLGEGFRKATRDDDVEILFVHANLDSYPVLREFDATVEIVLPLSMQYVKVLSGFRAIPAALVAASTNAVHLHVDIRPA